MKKVILGMITLLMLFTLTGCGTNKEENNNNNNQYSNQQNNNENNNNYEDDYIDDDEIIEGDDEDNKPIENEKVVIEEVINCDGCVYAYFSKEKDKYIGSTLSKDEYTTDVTKLKTAGGKQRHNFFGLILSGDTISRARPCVLKNNKVYCTEGSVDGRYHESNIAILNQIFSEGECKYISNGHTYTCTDTKYNGDTITTGYTSLHYETSCTVYGSEARTGELVCH